MKIAWAERMISPEVGTYIAGYGPRDESVARRDDLFLSVLGMDDGRRKVILMSFDLIGIDEKWIRATRRKVAALLGGAESDCILTCTHTHTGPHTRRLATAPEVFNSDYLETLSGIMLDAVREVLGAEWREVDAYFYSIQCDENRNRRFIGPENRCSFLPHRRDMAPIADGPCDKEMGGLFFVKPKTRQIEYIVGNYAAHPLSGHALGIAAHRISADFPGAYRRYLEREVGCKCMFCSGAAGDMVPHGDETGSAAIETVGTHLATATLDAMIHAMRNPDCFKLENTVLQSCLEGRNYALRPHKSEFLKPLYGSITEIALDVQAVSVGDLCLIGVPGELLTELGLEMKWHSPFRKTFVLYASTGYCSYLCYGNAFVSGGYEARQQRFDSRTGLALVNAAVDGAYELYERTFPDRSKWPENDPRPLVSLKNL